MRINKEIEAYLNWADLALTNAVNDPNISQELTDIEWDAAKMQEGRGLCDNALSLHRQQIQEKAEKEAAQDDFGRIADQALQRSRVSAIPHPQWPHRVRQTLHSPFETAEYPDLQPEGTSAHPDPD